MDQYETRAHYYTLQQVATEHKFQNPEIEIKAIKSGRDKNATQLFHAKISGKNRDTLHAFIKVAFIEENERPVPEEFYYSREIFMYVDLAKKLRLIEEKNSLTSEHRLKLPNFYATNTYLPNSHYLEEVIVLENLTEKGYSSFNRFTYVDWQFAAAAVEELAKLHALSIALEDENPEEFEKIFRNFQAPELHGAAANCLFKSAVNMALSVVKEENKSKLARKLRTIDFHNYKEFMSLSKRPVLTHGDYRLKNMMYRKKDDGSVEVIPVDYQTLRGGSPVVDLLYFIFTGTDKQFRDQYYEKLVDHYYSELSAALLRLGVSPDEKYSRKDFDEELREKLLFGLGVAVFTLPIVTVEAENAPTVDEDMDPASFSIEKTSSLYSERLNGVVDDFVRWGII